MAIWIEWDIGKGALLAYEDDFFLVHPEYEEILEQTYKGCETSQIQHGRNCLRLKTLLKTVHHVETPSHETFKKI